MFKEGYIINCPNCQGKILKDKGFIFPLGCKVYVVKLEISEKTLLKLINLKDDVKNE